MVKEISQYDATHVQSMIISVRGQRVILASDLAGLYGVQPKVLNQAVKRNADRFPDDFVFQLTREEAENAVRSRSQFVTSKRGSNIKYLPYVFTEHGAIMAANVLNSPHAVQMSVFVVRAFIRMRGMLSDTRELARQFAALEKELKERLDVHEVAIVSILQRVMDMIYAPVPPDPPRRQIGFKARERRSAYAAKKKKSR